MERKTAIATAGAITMSVVSVLFAVGASSGALGSSTASSPTPVPAVTSPSPSLTPTAASTPAATSRAVPERHSDDQVRPSPSGAGARSESDD